MVAKLAINTGRPVAIVVRELGNVELARKPSDRAIRTERFEQKAVWSHGASDGVFGSPKILADLHQDGVIIFRKTVAKVVRRLGFTRIRSSKWLAPSAFVVGSPACQIADKHRRSR